MQLLIKGPQYQILVGNQVTVEIKSSQPDVAVKKELELRAATSSHPTCGKVGLSWGSSGAPD